MSDLEKYHDDGAEAEELPNVELCGAKHPIHYRSVVCTLPAGHSTVFVSGMPFDHFDGKRQRAWRKTS